MEEDTWSWESDPCDFEGCMEPSTHRLYVGDDLRRRLCPEHMQQVASEHAWFWRDVIGTAARASEEYYRILQQEHPERPGDDVDVLEDHKEAKRRFKAKWAYLDEPQTS